MLSIEDEFKLQIDDWIFVGIIDLVFEDENGGIDKRMFDIKNAVLTPHVAWNTADAIVSLHKEVTDNVAKYLKGERPDSIVNGL